MADIVAPEVRSRMMSRIRSKDTVPELAVRRGLHKLGYRFRIHDKRLEGCPDIVLPKWRAVVFVHGCFWHGHDCHLFRLPSTRSQFWNEKIQKNRSRDRLNKGKLLCNRWRVATVWECALKGTRKCSEPDLLQLLSEWIVSSATELEVAGKK